MNFFSVEGGDNVAWLTETDLYILEKVFVDSEQMYLNQKGNLRQRFLGFYFTETKSLTLMCKNIDKFNHGIPISSQYKNTLRNIGLLKEGSEEISTYGNKLLKILYFDNNRLIKLIRPDNNGYSIETMDTKDAYQLEMLIYLVVQKTGEKGIGYNGNPIDVINNLNNLFAQIQDSLNSSKKSDFTSLKAEVKQYFDINNSEKLFLMQIMNYSGYEISRFLKLTAQRKSEFWTAFSRAIEDCPNNDDGLSDLEKKYYNMIQPYSSGKIQKDIRHRVKYALVIHIIIASLIIRQNKVKMIAVPDSDSLYCMISFEDIKTIFESCQLKDVFNFIIQNHESIYLDEIVKYYYLDNPAKFDEGNLQIAESLTEMQSKGINRGDKVILVDRNLSECIGNHTMYIKCNTSSYIQLERCNPINREIVKDILKEEEQ